MEFAVLHSDKCLQTRQMHIYVLSVFCIKAEESVKRGEITVLRCCPWTINPQLSMCPCPVSKRFLGSSSVTYYYNTVGFKFHLGIKNRPFEIKAM